ncbi:MAG: alpha-glucosidase [Eubacteriales bacterium]
MKLVSKNNEFTLEHNGTVILKHTQSQPLLYVGVGEETVEMYRGNFNISDYVVERVALSITEMVEKNDETILNFDNRIKGHVRMKDEVVTLTFDQLDETINRFWIRTQSNEQEKLFGLGEQMSYLNLKGRNFPIFTSEPGVGRDKSTYITWKSDVENQAGGDYYNTNFPQPTYISSNMYYLHMESTAYADFNFKHDSYNEIEVWEVPTMIRIETAEDYLQMYENVTSFFGRQPELPEWMYNGLIVGLQGGNERSFGLLDQVMEKGIKVSGVWCQDWCGKRVTSFGKRLQWDWKYHKEMYADLPTKIKELHARGIKFLGYVNPYLVKDGELYQEGYEKGYFATKYDGSDYLVDFGEFDCGVVDLTNPAAYEWFKKEVIIKHSIDIGIDGWMADFGEYLPTDDIKLHSGRPAMIEHNNWPVLWAKCNYDALVETDKIGDIVYFMRAGGARSGKYCTLLWAGDQSVDFSLHDGLASTIPAALSAGMSGVGISHSDIGGYTSLWDNIRTKELFLRWSEMAAFTPVMRTHEGNRPETNFQFYEDDETMEVLGKFVDIYTMISPYTKDLVRENAQKGIAVQRPLFVHYSEDERAYCEQYQYLYGKDLLVAPVHEEGKENWNVYLPNDSWVHIFTGKEYTKGEYVVDAPVGCPPVFYRKESEYKELFKAVTKKYGEN